MLTYGRPESHDRDNRGAEVSRKNKEKKRIVIGISVQCKDEMIRN